MESCVSGKERIIADEPTGSLEKKTGEETLAMRMCCAERLGQTLIVVTHDPDVASNADCVLCIEDGKLVNKK